MIDRGERAPNAGRRFPCLPSAPLSSACLVDVGVAPVSDALAALFISGSPYRRRPRAARRGVSGTIGMLLPGLIVCGSAIQAASEPRVVSSSPGGDGPAAADMGEIGPGGAGRMVPRMVWQAAHGFVEERLHVPQRPPSFDRLGRRMPLRARPSVEIRPAPRRSPATPCARAAGRRYSAH